MNIRDATVDDLPAIVEIFNQNVPTRLSVAMTEPVTVEERRPWFEEHDQARRPIWVAEEDERVAGWLSLSDFYDARPAYHATAEVGVYVHQDSQGRGLGRRLVGEAIRRAPGLGLKTLTAGIFAHNGASIALFRGSGFETWAHFPRVAELDGIERRSTRRGSAGCLPAASPTPCSSPTPSPRPTGSCTHRTRPPGPWSSTCAPR